jgi:hypothetical protein
MTLKPFVPESPWSKTTVEDNGYSPPRRKTVMSPVIAPVRARTTLRAFSSVANGWASVPGLASLPAGETYNAAVWLAGADTIRRTGTTTSGRPLARTARAS